MDAIGTGVGRFDHVDWRLLVVAVVCQLLGSVCHARAWANLLQAARPDTRVPRGAVLCAHLAGVAGNAVAPAHAGDAAKVVLIRRAVPGTAIATIVTTLLMLTAIDVVLGGGALLATASTSLGPAVPRPSGAGLLIPVGIALAAGAVALVARPRLAGVLEHVRQGAALLKRPGRFLREAVSWQVGCLARARRRRVRRAARLRTARVAAGCGARRRRDRAGRRHPLPARRGRRAAGDDGLRATQDRVRCERRRLRRRHAGRCDAHRSRPSACLRC